MRRALELARRGIPEASPNPYVGCVLVKNGRIVGEGWHARYGQAHAEPSALLQAGKAARGATAYVNLEPCCHTAKKTPPCVPSLLRAGVKEVFAGSLDPNPLVKGRGLRQLSAAGLKVTFGILREECEALNRPFFTRVAKGRPYVILKAAASLDGRIETAGGESQWITGPEARAESHRLRSTVDAILVGIETILADDPELTAHGKGRDPLRVVLDSRLRIPAKAKVLRGEAGTVVFTGRRDLRGGGPRRGTAVVRRVGRKGYGLDLEEVLRALGEMGVGSVLVEGGSRVHTAFLEAGLADELKLFLAPKLLGGRDARSFFEGAGCLRLKDAWKVGGLAVKRLGDDLLVSGTLD